MVVQDVLELRTHGGDWLEFTDELARRIARSGCRRGLCHLFLRHTSASICITENAAPEVRVDLQQWAEQLAPRQRGLYRHDDEGPDDMPAHIRSLVVGVELTVPVQDGRLLLGTWQGLYLWEHRQMGHLRQIVMTLSGEFAAD